MASRAGARANIRAVITDVRPTLIVGNDESGMDPDAKAFNMFFTKTDASISPAIGAVQRPEHVALLDYEIELALVFRRAVRGPVAVTSASLKDYVIAVAIANDVSARDVQLPQTQFFKGKSYRGFCPIGPWLTVLDPEEFGLLDRLDLRLTVNGVTRQSDNTANLLFKPAETISELSTFADIAARDPLLSKRRASQSWMRWRRKLAGLNRPLDHDGVMPVRGERIGV